MHIQVFVTPTCPYCPAAVRMGHSLAIASDMIQADMVESVSSAPGEQVSGIWRAAHDHQ